MIEMLDLAGQSVSRETFEHLKELEALVRRWSSAINLVSKSTLADLWDRHIVDSAQLFWMAQPAEGKWLDLGSGGGFPGLVIAILARDLPLTVTLVESDLRKATFLRQAAQALNLSVTVRSERIESLPPQSANVLSARALAALSDLLGYAHRHMRSDGLAILPKGARHAEEIDAARKLWSFDLDSRPSCSDPAAAILLIRNIHRAEE